eukprot:3932009-Rhodomonas_salina.3
MGTRVTSHGGDDGDRDTDRTGSQAVNLTRSRPGADGAGSTGSESRADGQCSKFNGDRDLDVERSRRDRTASAAATLRSAMMRKVAVHCVELQSCVRSISVRRAAE